jgi:hypothetical protein
MRSKPNKGKESQRKIRVRLSVSTASNLAIKKASVSINGMKGEHKW